MSYVRIYDNNPSHTTNPINGNSIEFATLPPESNDPSDPQSKHTHATLYRAGCAMPAIPDPSTYTYSTFPHPLASQAVFGKSPSAQPTPVPSAPTLPPSVVLGTRLETVVQLRTPTPNPWEVAWFLFCFHKNPAFDYDNPQLNVEFLFYALVLKPNGWEVSKQDPAYPGGQRFLASSSTPVFPINRVYRPVVRLTVPAPTDPNTPTQLQIDVLVNDEPLASFTDKERPYVPPSQATDNSYYSAVYCEDARVRFSDTWQAVEIPASSKRRYFLSSIA